jgi:hypothetical protein
MSSTKPNIPPGHFNSAIRNWGAGSKSALIGNIHSHDIPDTYFMLNHFKVGYKQEYGDIYAISFGMPKYGIMVHHGAGSGWKNGIRVGADSGGPGRVPRPFFSEIMDIRVPVLADKLMKMRADAMMQTELETSGSKTSNYRINL